MRISDWSSDVCSSDLAVLLEPRPASLGTPVADDDVLPHAVAGVDDQHGRLTVQDGHVNLTYLPPTDGGRFVAVVILDEDTPDRLYAISRDRKSTRLNSSH